MNTNSNKQCWSLSFSSTLTVRILHGSERQVYLSSFVAADIFLGNGRSGPGLPRSGVTQKIELGFSWEWSELEYIANPG